MAVEIVPLQEAHIQQIVEIDKRTNGAPWSEGSFKNELTNPNSIFLVAADGQKVIGYGGVWLVVDEAHITTLSVLESHREQGLGTQLMHVLLEKSIAAGMTCSTLEVRASNEAAIKLYSKLGYCEAARRKGYYPDNKEDAVVMWLYDLKNPVPAVAQ